MINERKEYLAAFVIGAIVGVGATLLMAPERAARPVAERMRRRFRPTRMQRRHARLRRILRSHR